MLSLGVMHTLKNYIIGAATTALLLIGMHRIAGSVDDLGHALSQRSNFSDPTLVSDHALGGPTLPTDLVAPASAEREAQC